MFYHQVPCALSMGSFSAGLNKTQSITSKQKAVNQHKMVCALVGLWIKNLELGTLKGHCLVFSGKANYFASLLLGWKLKKIGLQCALVSLYLVLFHSIGDCF